MKPETLKPDPDSDSDPDPDLDETMKPKKGEGSTALFRFKPQTGMRIPVFLLSRLRTTT
jgi:hypothetical protein